MTPPTKPTDNRLCIVRGGSWYNTSSTFVRAAIRNVRTPTYRYSNFGFRCAQRGCRMPLKVQP